VAKEDGKTKWGYIAKTGNISMVKIENQW